MTTTTTTTTNTINAEWLTTYARVCRAYMVDGGRWRGPDDYPDPRALPRLELDAAWLPARVTQILATLRVPRAPWQDAEARRATIRRWALAAARCEQVARGWLALGAADGEVAADLAAAETVRAEAEAAGADDDLITEIYALPEHVATGRCSRVEALEFLAWAEHEHPGLGSVCEVTRDALPVGRGR